MSIEPRGTETMRKITLGAHDTELIHIVESLAAERAVFFKAVAGNVRHGAGFSGADHYIAFVLPSGSNERDDGAGWSPNTIGVSETENNGVPMLTLRLIAIFAGEEIFNFPFLGEVVPDVFDKIPGIVISERRGAKMLIIISQGDKTGIAPILTLKGQADRPLKGLIPAASITLTTR